MKIDSNIKSNFQFVGNSINKIELVNDFLILPELNELKLMINAEYDIKKIWKDNEQIWGVIVLDVEVRAEQKSQKIAIKMSLDGCFIDLPLTEEKDFKSMLSLNGTATLYSIARAQIMGLSSQAMNGGKLILPMINCFHLKEEKEKKQFT